MFEEEQLAAETKKAIKSSKEAHRIQQQFVGSSKGAGITPEVPNEPKSSSVANIVAEIDWGSEEDKKNDAEREEEERDGDKEVTRDEQTVDDQAEDNQQEIHTVPSAPLLYVLVFVILEQPTPPTPTPLASPLPTPSITSEAPPITTTIPDPLLALTQRLDDLERKFDAWTKVDHSEAVEASV
ncbi:hypothetical protein Tco_0221280 [Tanacetum coccineum]